MRADVYLVDKGLAPSRTKAQELLRSGAVQILKAGQWQTLSQVSAQISPEDQIQILESSVLKYVSRGGLKLEGALEHLKLNVSDFRVLDVGQSTGGFTDCVLKRGAALVIGVDVGSGQLHYELKSDSRVHSFENLHLNQMAQNTELKNLIEAGVDLCVIDVSFISIRKALTELSNWPQMGRILGLVKPQFEVGAKALGKGGLVRGEGPIQQALQEVRDFATGLGFAVHDMFPSAVIGGDGNQEYFIFLTSNKRDV